MIKQVDANYNNWHIYLKIWQSVYHQTWHTCLYASVPAYCLVLWVLLHLLWSHPSPSSDIAHIDLTLGPYTVLIYSCHAGVTRREGILLRLFQWKEKKHDLQNSGDYFSLVSLLMWTKRPKYLFNVQRMEFKQTFKIALSTCDEKLYFISLLITPSNGQHVF